MYDEHGEPSEDLVTSWNEHNDHADDGEQPDEDEPDGCGYSYDHKLKVIGERDGIVNEVCDECGAELTTDTNADDPGASLAEQVDRNQLPEGWELRIIDVSAGARLLFGDNASKVAGRPLPEHDYRFLLIYGWDPGNLTGQVNFNVGATAEQIMECVKRMRREHEADL